VSDQINDPKNQLGFTHLDQNGEARMVDVGPKDSTQRRAVARGKIFMAPTTADAISAQSLKKGDVLGVARIAGIQAAKKTSDIIPLCHPLMLSSISVNFEVGADHVAIQAEVEVMGPTGVEMEALHACSAAALTIYDMCKAVDKSMVIGEVKLLKKSGGQSGDWGVDQ